eukprot:CAMPEP_0114991808 /NCGR_PEP_ID=MMETSP0216-20121206/11580_1 /TAXON_ID=223996 /ORGANISM="Protocruzia adherens, Strain Boccale" /LENGTH=590 /DNA_ID=CAMNT_0002355181 /DNA_START=29 /DNA_END=1801 /DNA_ORIENTATION=-
MVEEGVPEDLFGVQILREDSRNELLSIIDSIPGKKAVGIDPKISGPMSLIVGISVLKKEHAVTKVFRLEREELDLENDERSVIYFTKPDIEMMKCVALQIHDHKSRNEDKNYYLYMCPRETVLCEKILQLEGVLADVQIAQYTMDLIPLENDVLSLEMESSLRDLILHSDVSIYMNVANSIRKLEYLYGKIPAKYGKGKASLRILEILDNTQEEHMGELEGGGSEIDCLVMIDRTVDLVTPLCTQLTYEGLIDELFAINQCTVRLDPKVLGKESTGRARSIPLTNQDPIFSQIRDKNFSVLKSILSEKLLEIKKLQENKNNISDAQLSEYVSKFKQIQKEYESLTIHTNIADQINSKMKVPEFMDSLTTEQGILLGESGSTVMDFIEAQIGKQEPIDKVMRLLCLECLIHKGLKQKQFDFFRREIIQTYGYEEVFLLSNLERAGLFYKQETRSNWSTLDKKFKIINEDVNVQNPDDLSYVYSGYSPLGVKILDMDKNFGWKGMTELLELLPGPTVPPNTAVSMSKPVKNVLVFFVGGITFAEISAIRYLNTKFKDRKYLIATTQILDGNKMISMFRDEVENNLDRGNLLK